MKQFLTLLVVFCAIVLWAKPVESTPAMDFSWKEFSVPWTMTQEECEKAGFSSKTCEDDESLLCMGAGDMEYFFRRSDNKLAYCRIFGAKLHKATIRNIVNRTMRMLVLEKAGEPQWNDLPSVSKDNLLLEATYLIRVPDVVILYIAGYRGAENICEMRIFNPEFYPPNVKFIQKHYKTMMD